MTGKKFVKTNHICREMEVSPLFGEFIMVHISFDDISKKTFYAYAKTLHPHR